MIVLGQKISVGPDIEGNAKPIDAFVSYIHPEYRFYSVTYKYANGGKFTESKYFTYNEIQELRALGLMEEDVMISSLPTKRPKEKSDGKREIKNLDELEAML